MHEPITIHLPDVPAAGDLLFMRVTRQRSLIVPPAGWELMARWRSRREQLWSKVATAHEASAIDVIGATGEVRVRALRRGEWVQEVVWWPAPGRLERLRQRLEARRG